MSWTIGLYVGESFAEIAAKKGEGSTIPSKRWFLPQMSLERGIQNYLVENKLDSVTLVRVATRLGRQMILRRLGQVPAILVTAGFEDWPEMNLPIQDSRFTILPKRAAPPLSSHLVFGLTERINAQGDVEKALVEDDLEFLVSKLQMNKVDHLVLGLMHSTMNPEHERMAETYLRERGFQVFPSYSVSGATAEKPRWWHSVLNAYLEPAFKDVLGRIQKGFSEHQNGDPSIALTTGDSAANTANWERPLGSLFGSAHLLNSRRKDKGEALLYLGLEEFFLLPGQAEDQLDWISDFGRVHLPHPETKELHLQPTTLIAKSSFGCPNLSHEVAGFEPGPMCFGRGVKPLLLDVLYLNSRLSHVEVLGDHVTDKMDGRIKETLSAYAREASSESDFSAEDICHWLEEMALHTLASEIRAHSRSQRVRVAGPLSPVLTPLLTPLLTEIELSPLCVENRPLCEHLLADGDV
ncbi:MAG: hypothetical protein H6624_15815 [Bdellovibrionaceae bacterium]|nr:hypothetical protein [Bdellovibrionales bacterium]MCB9085814.1 hypothetical protein [Pseudobdellovibrionaceae bacterium]